MKLNFTCVSEEVRFALTEGLKELDFEEGSDGITVCLGKCEKGVHVQGGAEGPWKLEYADISAFMRGLSLLSRYAGKGEAFDVEETPSLDTLGPMIDCSRNAVMKPETVKRMIRVTALLGYNAMMLYTEDTYEVPGEPYFGHLRGRYSQAQLRALDDYAAALGVELIPCIQMLAHLSALFKWPVYGGLADWDDILNLSMPRVYELIENMVKAMRGSLRSKKINIGMDEAYILGRGRYLEKMGYRDSSEIMLEHLARVTEILKRYDYQPRMWSDMFFRMCNEKHDYYSEDTVISGHVKSIVPPEITLVYWDYYGDNRAKYDRMMDLHQQFNNPMAFAGGASCWYGGVPLNYFSLNSARTAIAAAEAHGLKEIYVTMWGDNGGLCSGFATLPTLTCYAEYNWNGRTDDEDLAEAMASVSGADYRSFMDFEKLMDPCGRKNFGKAPLYPTRYMLYQDILQGKFDTLVPDGTDEFYAGEVVRLQNERAEAPEKYRYLYDTFIALADALSVKAELGKKLKAAYDAKDREALRAFADEKIPETIDRIDELHSVIRKQWMYENSAFGFEVHDIRFGGLKARLTEACAMIEEYLDGTCEEIEELEAERLPYDPEMEDDGSCGIYNSWLNLWSNMVTQNGI